jgi:hypothetical protein
MGAYIMAMPAGISRGTTASFYCGGNWTCHSSEAVPLDNAALHEKSLSQLSASRSDFWLGLSHLLYVRHKKF